MSNVRPGNTIEEILDDAYCGTGKWELCLKNWESPRLDSRARAYPLPEGKEDAIVIDCEDIREQYRVTFAPNSPSNARPLAEKYNEFQLAIMSLIVRRFEELDHASNKGK